MSSVSEMSPEEKSQLGSMQLASLEVVKSPTSEFDVAIKSYVDTKFSDAVTQAQQGVTDLIAGAPAQLDTLKEISTALGDNANLASVLVASIASVQTSLNTEIASRVEADGKQDVSDATEKALRDQYRLDDANMVEMKVSAETSMRMESEQQIRSDFAYADQEEKDARLYAENSLNNKITKEKDDRTSAIASEASTRASVDASLVNLVEEEKTLRVQNCDYISTRVDTEVQDRVLAIGVESSARTLLGEQVNDRISEEKQHTMSSITTVYEDLQALGQSKFSVSPYYSGGSETPFTISEDSFLCVGDFWRLRALNSGTQKRLVFEHRVALDAPYKTAIPFIRQA